MRSLKHIAAILAFLLLIALPLFVAASNQESIIGHMAVSSYESPQLNGQRFLLAVDIIAAKAMQTQKSDDLMIQPIEREYLNSLSARSIQREELADLGIKIHSVPAFGDEEVGINYLNAVHLSNTVLFPALGGFFETLDIAAAEAFRQAFGNDIEVQPIATSAAQQAYGGVHCLVSLYPAMGLDNSKADN